MNQNTDGMRAVKLADLFWEILFGWRRVICCALVFAVVLVGVKYGKDIKVYQKNKNLAAELENESSPGGSSFELTVKEWQAINDASSLEKRIKKFENYMEQSAYMSIDPYAENRMEIQYYVDSDYIINYTRDNTKDYTDDVVNTYCNYITSGEVSKGIIDKLKLDITTEDFSELISVQKDDTTILVNIIYPNGDELTEIADRMDNLLKNKEAELQEIGTHTLKLIQKNQNVVVDQSLITARDSILNSIMSLKNQLKVLENEMTDTQKQILAGEKEDSTEEGEETELSKPQLSMKYMVLGLAIGIMLGCIWSVLLALYSGKMQNGEEMQSIFGMRIFGKLDIGCEEKKPGRFVDRKIKNWKNRKKKKLSQEQQMKLAAANIGILCKKEGIEHIYITGSEYENINQELKEQLKIKLREQNLEISEGNDIFYDVSSLEKAVDINNILLIEKPGLSLYEEIANEIRLAEEHNICILGAVVCE